jgi:hypothetical protein
VAFKWTNRALLATCLHTCFLLGLYFDPEDGGDMFLRNVGSLSTDYTALYPRRYCSSEQLLWEPQILHDLSVELSYSFRAWMKHFHDLLRGKHFSLSTLLGWSSSCVTSLMIHSRYLVFFWPGYWCPVVECDCTKSVPCFAAAEFLRWQSQIWQWCSFTLVWMECPVSHVCIIHLHRVLYMLHMLHNVLE